MVLEPSSHQSIEDGVPIYLLFLCAASRLLPHHFPTHQWKAQPSELPIMACAKSYPHSVDRSLRHSSIRGLRCHPSSSPQRRGKKIWRSHQSPIPSLRHRWQKTRWCWTTCSPKCPRRSLGRWTVRSPWRVCGQPLKNCSPRSHVCVCVCLCDLHEDGPRQHQQGQIIHRRILQQNEGSCERDGIRWLEPRRWGTGVLHPHQTWRRLIPCNA